MESFDGIWVKWPVFVEHPEFDAARIPDCTETVVFAVLKIKSRPELWQSSPLQWLHTEMWVMSARESNDSKGRSFFPT